MVGGSIVLGAGVTGLAAGLASGLPVYEAEERPGGICSSYYICPGQTRRLDASPSGEEAYRFELGGGHWIFGGDRMVLRFISEISALKAYARRSAVYFPEQGLRVPYPIQNHLRYLGPDIAARAVSEMLEAREKNRPVATMAEWLQASFGPTLCQLFFEPFHERYTGGLWREIMPQDDYKSPVRLSLVVHGALAEVPPAGYNVQFVYPMDGLNRLAQRMAERCVVHYGHRAVRIDTRARVVCFEDGSEVQYQTLLSTLPLNRAIRLSELNIGEPADPSVSVLVINIGAKKGARCPEDHWVYIPRSRARFHRVGFYSNVDASFLPKSSRASGDRVSIYVERAFRDGERPQGPELSALCQDVVREIQEWKWIGEAEVVDPTWIDVAYTWSWCGSRWKEQALQALESHRIYQIGRFARWIFQGIADSIRDGLMVGATFRL